MIQWIALLIALVMTIVKLLASGKDYKNQTMFALLAFLIGTLLAIAWDFLSAVVASESFAFTITMLLPYLLWAALGAVIVPLALALSKLNLK